MSSLTLRTRVLSAARTMSPLARQLAVIAADDALNCIAEAERAPAGSTTRARYIARATDSRCTVCSCIDRTYIRPVDITRDDLEVIAAL